MRAWRWQKASWCWGRRGKRRRKATHFNIFVGSPEPKESVMALTMKLTTKEKEFVAFVPADANENEVKAEEPVVYAVVSGTVTVDAQPDGVSAFIVSGDIAEDAQVSVTSKSGAVVSSIAVNVTVAEEVATHFIETASAPIPK